MPLTHIDIVMYGAHMRSMTSYLVYSVAAHFKMMADLFSDHSLPHFHTFTPETMTMSRGERRAEQ